MAKKTPKTEVAAQSASTIRNYLKSGEFKGFLWSNPDHIAPFITKLLQHESPTVRRMTRGNIARQISIARVGSKPILPGQPTTAKINHIANQISDANLRAMITALDENSRDYLTAHVVMPIAKMIKANLVSSNHVPLIKELVEEAAARVENTVSGDITRAQTSSPRHGRGKPAGAEPS